MYIRKIHHKLYWLCCLTPLFLACGNKQSSGNNWLQDDDVKIAIDETFRPIMQDLADTYGMANPEANMKPLFVSEDSALRLLVNDSLRCCIATRALSDKEKIIVEGHHLGVSQALIATDAIALIVNKESKDSLITLDEVKGIVSGKITRWEQLKHHSRQGELKLVFDHSGSSTVRYMKDSLCNGQDLKGNVYASEGGTNQSVIEMVKANPNLIGVIGTNWLRFTVGRFFRVAGRGNACEPYGRRICQICKTLSILHCHSRLSPFAQCLHHPHRSAQQILCTEFLLLCQRTEGADHYLQQFPVAAHHSCTNQECKC